MNKELCSPCTMFNGECLFKALIEDLDPAKPTEALISEYNVYAKALSCPQRDETNSIIPKKSSSTTKPETKAQD